MNNTIETFEDLKSSGDRLENFQKVLKGLDAKPSGICGFDGFIDTFIRLEAPDTMEDFADRVRSAAGISASYPAEHRGDKFGGNGPLLASGLHGLWDGGIDLTYIGALGDPEVLPIFREAVGEKMSRIVSIAEPAHSDCLEFRDGKIMLSDLRACADVTWERVLDRMGESDLDDLLKKADFIGAVNWGKLIHVGEVWKGMADALSRLGREKDRIPFFMDLAEFEQRPEEDRRGLIDLVGEISRTCHTILSMNLKEGWQLAKSLGEDFDGEKSPSGVARLAAFLQEKISTDRVVVHPNRGAACASSSGSVYVAGPFCEDPLVSTGAGDHFGAGCVTAALAGLDDFGVALLGVCASGFFVRTGEAPSIAQTLELLEKWRAGTLGDRWE